MCPVKTAVDKTLHTKQGQAWDQLARTAYGAEKLMHYLKDANNDEADVLLFSGNVSVAVPQVAPRTRQDAINNLPPWERF